MARQALKFALRAATLAVVSGCTHFNVNSGELPESAEPMASPVAMESAPAVTYASHTPATPVAPHSHAKECTPKDAMASKRFFREKERKAAQIKVNATGYGAPPKSFYPEPQRRLMAMRAAKVDAYRSLAERVNGLRIWGGTTIGDMVVEKDRYRVFLDAFVRGAEIIAENPMEDGTYETVVELVVGQEFLEETLEDVPTMAANDPCAENNHSVQPVATAMPAPMLMQAPAPAAAPAPAMAAVQQPATQPRQEQQETPASSFYFADDNF